jgi:hypothetical protein
MLWGWNTIEGVGIIVAVNININGSKYIAILEDCLWPLVARHFPANKYVFQDDNAPAHRARIAQQYKQENRIHSMSWKVQSLDLNITENVWLHLTRELKKRLSSINTTADLEQGNR